MNLKKLILSLVLASIMAMPRLDAQVYINEVMASNATILADPEYGNFSDWIELYNPGNQDMDLSGFYLSDDPGNPGMWEFQSGTILPSQSYLLVFADGTGYGLHTNFKLAAEGEHILLLDARTMVIDSFSYPPLPADISYGRNADQVEELAYLASPSPGESNGNQLLLGISATPLISLSSGFYSGSQSLTLTTDRPTATIYYTLDGREPTEESSIVPAQLEISETTVLRVRSYELGYLPGPVITSTFFIDEPQHLPIISLVTDPDHFFDDETGIYVQGTAGVPGYCTEVPHNVNQDWERPVNIELFELDGTVGLNQVAGAKIFGGCSRTRYPIKSLGFYARKQYGDPDFKYRLFPDKPNASYETFILRAAADDQPFTLFRDGLAQMLVKDVIDVDMQAYRPAVLYINGAYWGIHNMREKINEHYPEDNFGVNADSVDLIKRNPEDTWNAVSGNADHYNAMIQYLRDSDITEDVHYEYMKTRMDMDEYINYQIIQIFFGARDWPGNNIKFWRSREAPYDRWRWVLYDLDSHLKDPYSDIMYEATDADCGCTWPNPPWSTYLFRSLLENEAFRHEFTQRFALYANTHFSRDRIHSFIDKMEADLAPEIPRHIERWGGQVTSLPDNTWVTPNFNSVDQWEQNVQVMRDFTDTRLELAMKHLHDYFGTLGYVGLKSSVEPAGTGSLVSAGMEIRDTTPPVDFLSGESISARAEAESGYLFSHWEIHFPATHDTALVKQGDLWNYIVSEYSPGTDWTSPDYDDQHWASGQAQLGYGDGDEATIIDFGGNPDDKFITSWFRKRFSIEDSSIFRRYTLKLLRDDGARVYINGREVIRDNMQRWSLGATATAQTVISGEDESVWLSFGLNPALFRQGDNMVAVEIHQGDKTSSDLSFDLELIARSQGPGTSDTLYSPQLDFELTQDTEITARMITDTTEVVDIFINEIMASNDAGLVDEAGEYEDWIELYNAGNKAVDLAGLYLADTLPAAAPWMFPEGLSEITTLHPGEFMVVFADNDPQQGFLHAGFKLSKEGEEVALLQKIGSDTVLIDQLLYNFQVKNISFGRFPDGSSVLELMTMATPGAPNSLETSLADPLPKAEGEISVYPVPTHGTLFVKLNEATASRDIPVDISLYSISGSKVAQSTHHSTSLIQLSMDQLSAGMYIIRVEAGDQIHLKRIIVQ